MSEETRHVLVSRRLLDDPRYFNIHNYEAAAGLGEGLHLHARRITLSEDVNLALIARGTPGLSGAAPYDERLPAGRHL